ncbi:uncharacterized protein LOC136032931 [Artemia franciscana]|uniref:uncharacterized protein LOC136032931 n=1 Tax=Artemia franciscana TaxID=6661 RepID=UPI0032DB4615
MSEKSEKIGNICFSTNLEKVTRREAAVLKSAEDQLRRDHGTPEGSLASVAQVAADRNRAFGKVGRRMSKPQVFLQPLKTEIDHEKYIGKEDLGHIHIQADLEHITEHEASVLQSLESKMHGNAPKRGLASVAWTTISTRSSQNQNRKRSEEDTEKDIETTTTCRSD